MPHSQNETSLQTDFKAISARTSLFHKNIPNLNGNIKEVQDVLFDIKKHKKLEIGKSHAHESLHKTFKEIKILRGIIPICTSFKQIRDDKGFWYQVDTYLRDHTEADFSDTLCPKCYEIVIQDIRKE